MSISCTWIFAPPVLSAPRELQITHPTNKMGRQTKITERGNEKISFLNIMHHFFILQKAKQTFKTKKEKNLFFNLQMYEIILLISLLIPYLVHCIFCKKKKTLKKHRKNKKKGCKHNIPFIGWSIYEPNHQHSKNLKIWLKNKRIW